MRQGLDRSKASKADDVVVGFEASATQQMPKNWRTRKKWIIIKIFEHNK